MTYITARGDDGTPHLLRRTGPHTFVWVAAIDPAEADALTAQLAYAAQQAARERAQHAAPNGNGHPRTPPDGTPYAWPAAATVGDVLTGAVAAKSRPQPPTTAADGNGGAGQGPNDETLVDALVKHPTGEMDLGSATRRGRRADQKQKAGDADAANQE
jgi:hypothetical protein